MKEEVPAALAGERIDRVIAAMTGLPRAAVADLIEQGAVTLAGQVTKSRSLKVSGGQPLEVELPDLASGPPQPDPTIEFDVVHEDGDLIVINKPAGLVVHPGNAHESDTLVNGLLARFPDMAASMPGDAKRPGIVHRLDGGTSGLLIAARTQRAYDALIEMMKTRQVERVYLTMVWGDVEPDRGVIDAPIGRSDRDRTKMAVSTAGRAARTQYEVIKRSESPNVSLVDAKLETGRTHQIRVHFAAISHAVVGDARYRGVRPGVSIGRPFLHAPSLTFEHPITKKQMHFETPIPEDLQNLIDAIFPT